MKQSEHKLKVKTINRRFIFWPVFVLSLFVSFSPGQTLAVGNAYFPQDTTINLTVDGISTNFVILGGSDANEVTVSASTISINISSGQTITLKSSSGNKLNNNGGFSYSCSANESSLTLTVSSTQTVVISPDEPGCAGGGGGGGGGAGAVGGTGTSASTPTSVPSPVSGQPAGAAPSSRGFTGLTALNLEEGDVMSAAGSDDPDVYIVNDWGYKRLFLNPVIFGFYGHLGGFTKVKSTTAVVRDTLVTSGLFRNCETNDEKVYGVETTGEDTGMLHWVNTTGAQAVADDPDFFKKVFCINSKELNWYPKGSDYTSVNQIPDYSRP